MICQKCGLDFPEKEITEECLSLFSEEELKYGLGLDWWNHENEADALSSEHPAVKYHYLTKLRLWLLATILEKNPEDLSYYPIAKQESKIIGTALCKLCFPQHPVMMIRKTPFIYLYIPIHPYPNKVMGMDFLETRLNLHTKVEYTWMCYECHKKEHKKNESLLQN